MTAHNLDEFFSAKRSHASPSEPDWEKKREEWIGAIEELYRLVAGFLEGPREKGAVTIGFQTKSITEELLGTYPVREMVLRVGEEAVVFSPKGRNIVGASGRVDLRGEMGEATLILQPGPRWALLAQRVPSVKLVPLDENSLLRALTDVMRP